MVRASFELRDREIWDGVKGPTVCLRSLLMAPYWQWRHIYYPHQAVSVNVSTNQVLMHITYEGYNVIFEKLKSVRFLDFYDLT